jgi:Concanavalin A-like lectin/glucanases superfamily
MTSSFKNLIINDTGYLQFPNGTVANRPTTTATIIRWTNTGSQAVSVLSGTATTTTTSWTCPTGVTSIEVLVVAGGGGGGSTYHAGGGGAGGLIYRSVYPVTPGTVYSITVGTGGAGGTSGLPGAKGTNGSNSSFDILTAIGGGGGASYGVNSSGSSGGSGGGGAQLNTAGWVNYIGGTGTAGQGFSGGNSAFGYDNSWMGAGGGGGAGGPGQAGDNFPDQVGGGTGGLGGPGLPFDISGTLTYYAGGGGGSGPYQPGAGGNGGGGAGGSCTGAGTGQGVAGTASTGGGGGGSERSDAVTPVAYAGGAGGSGVVIIRYFQDATSSDPNAQLRFNTGTQVTEAFAANKWRDLRNNLDIINDGLVLYIDPAKYIAGAGTVTDLSPNSATCTLNNGVGYSTANGGYFTFDGVNDYIRIPMSSAINTCQKGQTISYWAYPTGLGDYHFFNNHIQTATGVGAVSGAILAFGSGGTLTYQNRINNTCCQTVSGVGVYTANKWIHITGAWDGQNMRVYKNGQLVSGLAAAGTLNMINDIYLGVNSDTFAGNGTYAQQATGRLGPVMLYNRALSDEEIKRNYNVHVSRYDTVPQAAFAPTYVKDNLVMCMDPELKYYDFSTQIIYDAAGAENITLSNGTSFNQTDRSIQFNAGTYSYLGGSSIGVQRLLNTTLDAWIYITSYSGRSRQYIIDMRGNGSDVTPNIYLLLDYQSGTDIVKFTINTGGGELISPNISCTLNTWHHICATRDYATNRIYLDGIIIAQNSQNGAGQSDYTMNQPFRIGTYAGAVSSAEYYFNGKMAGARMYNRTLTYQEIQQNYQALKYRYGLM